MVVEEVPRAGYLAAPPKAPRRGKRETIMATELKYTQSFKKYTDEYRPEVVDFVREWARTHELLAVHEDNSLIKVTGTKARIADLLAELKERFDYTPPDASKKKKK